MKTNEFVKVFIVLIAFLFSSIHITAQEASNTDFDKLINNWTHFHDQGKYDRAIEQAQQAFKLAGKTNQRGLQAIALNREGRSLMKITRRVNRNKNRKEATDKLKQSLLYLTGFENPELRIDNLENLKWLADKNNDQKLVNLYNSQIAEVRSQSQANDTNEQLTEKIDSLAIQKEQLVAQIDSFTEAQLKSELLIALQKNKVDSFAFEGIKDSFLIEQKELMLGEQMAISKSQKSQRNFFLALAAIIGFLAIGAVFRYRETQKNNTLLASKNQIIKKEQKRSDDLLLNILPAVVAKELKANGVAKAKRYEEATVFFSDFKNFSGIARNLSPEQLVFELDFHFKAFDQIIGKYNLEKIKTIGDAYMCVGGLPEERPGHALDVVRAALEIQDYLASLKKERLETGQPFFEARIGIHSGPLVAGVVGSRKFAYDIWGDTVNIAARLEENSEAGKVNISAATFAAIRSQFDCESRGKIPIKNLGEVEMYFVKGANGLAQA